MGEQIKIIRPIDFTDTNKHAQSIFLAGPTYRIPEEEVNSFNKPFWRKQVIDLLEQKGFKGNVYYPEWENNLKPYGWTLEKQIEWENKYLNSVDAILFWVPRNMEDLPALTTNIEFGEWMHSGKIVIGAPESAVKMEYIEDKCKTNNIPFANSMPTVVDNVINLLTVKNNDHIWFTADTHFSSKRALTLSRRPFNSVNEMDWEIIKRWNTKISPNDTVYHLGDFGNPEILKHLNFHEIFIIPGNYENDDPENEKQLRENGAIILPYMGHLKLNEISLLLIHEPEQYKGDIAENEFYLFGHIHDRQKCKRWGLDVGVDAHHFYPINLNDVFWWINAIRNHYDNNVFM